MIVVQRLKGMSITELCAEHQITQSQYYVWRDQFRANMHQVFIIDGRKEKALTKEDRKLSSLREFDY